MHDAPAGRSRLIFAGAAVALLLVAVLAVVLTSGSDSSAEVPADCLTSWNEDPLALSDGAHAFADHGYRESLLTRIDDRCAVVFATANVEFERDFGVRVLNGRRWAGLAETDGVPLDEIEAMQEDATETSNVTLLPDGRLASIE